MSRRALLTALAGVSAGFALPWLKEQRAHAGTNERARRILIYYFPDGVVGPSADGSPSLWRPSGNETDFSLPSQLESLKPHQSECVFLSGLHMGSADEGSHPGGAKKLLTGADGGGAVSLDQHLAASVGADAPFRHLYLGAMANQNGASGDKHISYPAPGTTTPPQDDPALALRSLFAGASPIDSGGAGGASTGGGAPDHASVIDYALTDINALRARLGQTERAKLDLHLASLREIEARVHAIGGAGGGGVPATGSCDDPLIEGVTADSLYNPSKFPAVLKAQMDLMVQAMACGLTRVGVVQASHHTSELIMSRFEGTEMHDPSYDMRSHQASHYGPSHNPASREYSDFLKQRRWFVEQFAYLIESLRARPEGDGTMLDHSVLMMCSEVSDGNTHSHHDMPFVLAGRGGGAVRVGRHLEVGERHHGALLQSLARTMGDDAAPFGDAMQSGLPGLLSI